MPNTVIALKKSATPSATPSDLANGELAINYSDGKLYYKHSNGTIVQFSAGGAGSDSFGTVNANGTLIVADTAGDILTLEAGDNITITADAINDKITISATGGSSDISPALIQANTARDHANAAFNQANTARTHANSAFDQANTARTHANTAYESANAGLVQANTARVHANTAHETANGALIQANTARDHANTAHATGNAALTQANTARTHANTAHETANAAIAQANTARTHANSAFDQANTARTHANSAFAGANAALIQANTARDHANSAFAGANAAIAQANTARTHANTAHETANSALTQANTARTHANTAHLTANAAFDKANNALPISGGTITGNLSVVGTLTVSGNTYSIDAENLRVSDPLIYLAGNNYVSDIVDIGFIGNYVNSTGQNVHTGLYREHEDKMYYLFQGYDKEPANNHIGALSNNMSLAVLNADIRTSNILLANTNTVVWIRSTFDQANTGRDHANTAHATGNAALTQANTARDHANSAFAGANAGLVQANTARTHANAAFDQANTARTHANTAHGTANAGLVQANTARDHANAAFAKANTASGGAYFSGNNGDVGSATGLGDIFRVHTNTLNSNVTIYSGNNALAAGPITVATNRTLTIQANARVAIV